jgi:peroxiredoxin
LADYREHYPQILAAGATLAALSVDAPERSETLRRELQLPFPILCDPERRVVRDWDVYSPLERGGIAKPSVFVIDADRKVRYAAVDGVATRRPPAEILRVLQKNAGTEPIRSKIYVPRAADWVRALRNNIRRRP